MALNEFIDALSDDWDNVEPRLSMAKIAVLHQIIGTSAPPRSLRDAAPEAIAALIAEQLQSDLPPNHDAWDALAASRYRFEPRLAPSEDTRARLGRLEFRIQQSLTSPEAPGNAVSDYLTDLAISRLITDAVVLQADVPPIDNALSLTVGGTRHYPTFQFTWVPTNPGDLDRLRVFGPFRVAGPAAGRPTQESVVTYAARVHPLIPYSADALDAETDPAGCIGWWLTGNSWLATTPAELLHTPREQEIRHALDQLDNDSW